MSEWKELPQCKGVSYARYLVPNFASNSICIEETDFSANKRYTVISPGESLLDGFRQQHPDLEHSRGDELRIVMPNSYHFMGVEAWARHYPNAALYASPQAIKRLETKGISGILPIKRGTPNLNGKGFWATPPGHRGGDVWCCLPTDFGQWCWITCDSFLNHPRMSNQPVARFIQKAMGAAPGLKLSKVIKYLLLTNRSAFKNWSKKFLADYPPSILLPSHGVPLIDDQLPAMLDELIESRL